MLSHVIPEFPSNVIVVPVPTIPSHIRQRGYDHTALIARRFAKVKSLPYQKLIERVSYTKQRGASRKQRFEQASQAFTVKKRLSEDSVYLLIDDVITTGATAQYAAEALLAAGASEVWVGVIARQPLDKPGSHLLK